MRYTLIATLWWCHTAALLAVGAAQAANGEPAQLKDVRKTYDAASQVVWSLPLRAAAEASSLPCD